ncbi:uncharacterized protein [Clinocottus analis]|uniref:uncharacterized protein n=1 Tax=Clinocottus analis TaxID=304258 RepID=UPI0035C145DB
MLVDFRRKTTAPRPLSVLGEDMDIVVEYNKMLELFYQSVVASVLYFSIVCWGSSIGAGDTNRLNKLVKKAGSIIGCKQEHLEQLVERRTLKKLLSMLENPDHPLQQLLQALHSLLQRLIMTPVALLLLLAAAVSQVDSGNIVLTPTGGHVDISRCPIVFHGQSFSWLHMVIFYYTVTARCGVLPVCTVTGSSVIDFHGRLFSIKDRCRYSLMNPRQGVGSVISAGFLERRRKDASHLDHVLITHSNKNFTLGQGGTAVVEGKPLKLSSTAQEVHGVKLSKDQTGVTAELLSSKVKVFFDGNTAHVSGAPVGVQGLCGDPREKSLTTTAAAMKTLVTDCATLHKDAADSTIDCKSSTERCNLLKQAPFTAGHKLTDPQPFIDACIETLCKYPAVDGLKCQFMEAYAESYRLKANVDLADWRLKVNCSVPKASCLQHHCSKHEFCGEKLGERHCFCRALFSSNYTDTLGEPAVCKKDSATVSLAGCLLQEKGIDYTVLHLKDPTCKGLMDKDTHMVTFSFDSSKACGTKVSTTDTQILYKNAIVTRDASKAGVITRHDQVNIDFSCLYKKPDITSVSFKIKSSSVVKEIVSGDWKYTLMMNAYTDAGRTSLISKTTAVKLNQQIWVELKTTGLDGGMVSVVTDSCWATNEAKANSTVKYHLVKDGCPNKADGTVKMEGNGKGTSTVFSFNMFEFSAKKSEIYLHCKLELCITTGSKPCAPVCPSKRKRRSSGSEAADGNPALITMAWSK